MSSAHIVASEGNEGVRRGGIERGAVHRGGIEWGGMLDAQRLAREARNAGSVRRRQRSDERRQHPR